MKTKEPFFVAGRTALFMLSQEPGGSRNGCLFQAFVAEQGIGIGTVSGKAFVEFHRVFVVA